MESKFNEYECINGEIRDPSGENKTEYNYGCVYTSEYEERETDVYVYMRICVCARSRCAECVCITATWIYIDGVEQKVKGGGSLN